jgi:hypothetical protein
LNLSWHLEHIFIVLLLWMVVLQSIF